MNYISQPIEIADPAVKNWGHLENWKSTAPLLSVCE